MPDIDPSAVLAPLDVLQNQVKSLLFLPSALTELNRQVQTLQGGRLEPVSAIAGWKLNAGFTDPTLAGAATFVGRGQLLLSGPGITFLRPANSPYLEIKTSGALMNADYVVDSNGLGTHLTLFGATGALAAAITDAADRFIWVCTTHVENVAATSVLGVLTNGQTITIASGSHNRAMIKKNFSTGPLFTLGNVGAGTGERLIWQNIRFTTAFADPWLTGTGGLNVPNMEFDGVEWSTSGGATYSYLFDNVNTVSITNTTQDWLMRRCFGNVTNIVSIGASSASTGDFLMENCVMSVDTISKRVSGTAIDWGLSSNRTIVIRNNILNVTFYAWRRNYNVPMQFNGNQIRHTPSPSAELLQTTLLASTDFEAIGNNYVCLNTAGSFILIGTSVGGGVKNINISGNAFDGGGSATAMTITGAQTDCAFSPNGYVNWTTNNSGGVTAWNGGLTIPAGSTLTVGGNAVAAPGSIVDIISPVGAGAGLTLLIPRFPTTAQPASTTNGMIYYDTTTTRFVGRENGAWATFVTNEGEGLRYPLLKGRGTPLGNIFTGYASWGTDIGSTGYSGAVTGIAGLVGYWKCGEASGNLADTTAGAFTMVATGTATYGLTGPISGDATTAISLPGVNTNYFTATVANGTALDTGDVFSITAWVKPVNFSAQQCIISRPTNGYDFRIDASGNLNLTKTFVASIVTGTTPMSAGAYHFLVVTKNGATVKLYIDNVDVTGAVTNATISSAVGNVVIGRNAQDGGVPLNSTLGQVNVYNVALTAANVNTLWVQGSAGAPVPANTTDGDITGIRLFVGNNALVSEARKVQIIDTFTPVSGAFNTLYIQTTASPGVGLAADEIRAAKYSVNVSPTANYAGQASGLYNEAIHSAGAFNIAELNGHFAQAIQNLAGTTVTILRGMKITSRAIAGTISNAIGLEIIRGVAGDAGTIGTSIGLQIDSSTPAPTTDIAILTLGGHHRFLGAAQFGLNSTPLNAVAGDVTAKRMVVGDEVAITGQARWMLNTISYVPSAVHTTAVITDRWAPAGLGSTSAAFEVDAHIGNTAIDNGEYWGGVFTAYHDGGSTFALTGSPSLVGLEGTVVVVAGATGTVTEANGVRASIRPLAAGTITWARSIASYPGGIGPDSNGVGIITNSAGLYIANKAASVAITNQHGLYIEALTGGATNIAIRSLGGEHRLVGSVKIGADSSPGVALDIVGAIWNSTYVRVGANAAPSNTTAGDINGIRGFFGADAAIGTGLTLDVRGAVGIANNQPLRWLDFGGVLRTGVQMSSDDSFNLFVTGGGTNHLRILNQAGAAVLWQITNAGVQDIDQLYANNQTLKWVDSGAVNRNVLRYSTDDFVNIFTPNTAGKKIRILDQAGATELWSTDTSGNTGNAGWLRAGSVAAPVNTTAGDLTSLRLSIGNVAIAAGAIGNYGGALDWLIIGTPANPAASYMRQFAHGKSAGVYQNVPRWLDAAGHDSSTVMRAKNVLPLSIAPVSLALTNVIPSATLGIVGMVVVKTPIMLHEIDYNIGTVAAGVNGVIRLALYTESGALITGTNVTDSPGLVTGVQTKVLPADVYLPAGNYYAFFCMSVNETVTNPAISCFTQEATFQAVAGEDILCGTVVVAAGAAPDPLGAITSVANSTPYFKFGGAAT